MNSNVPNARTEDSLGSLLDHAANNDLQAFKTHVDRHPAAIDEMGPWYSRQMGSSQMALHHLTPLMVSAIYGSLDVLKLIISSPNVDVNSHCGPVKSTALHCAASGGSPDAAVAVRILLAAGADPNLTDADGRRPVDTVSVPPKSSVTKCTLQLLLSADNKDPDGVNSPTREKSVRATTASPERKEYPIDPSFPDIKNSIYSTDEFRMFSFKVRPCARAYSHDWTECPFVHPGENARRRDPRKYHYSCVPCPDFRKGACRRGDMCEYAHGVFECWLHPAQYRTRLCKDGPGCSRRVCFFAHAQDEIRPLYVSTGSAFNPTSLYTPSMSPSAAAAAWSPLPNVPPLHLPGSVIGGGALQSSRLRSSLNARDIHDEFANGGGFEDLGIDLLGRASFGLNTVMPSNLDDVFLSEGSCSSPRYVDFSPTHKSAVHNQFQQVVLPPVKTALLGQRNMDQSFMLSPGRMSPNNADPGSPASGRVSILRRQESERFGRPEVWSNWGAEWVDDEVGSRLKRSPELLNEAEMEEPDLWWVQSLVKESPQDMEEKSVSRISRLAGNEEQQSVLGAWLEQMQLDQLMAQ